MLKLVSQLRIILLDLMDWCIRVASGKRHLPPARLRDVGNSDFEETGREFLNYFIQLCNLQPTARVLEIGCGVGRIALPLTGHLRDGSYLGMDLVAASIRWCQRHITPKHPNFRFDHVDLLNRRYNPQGRAEDKHYRFPYAGQSFDFIFLTSVFTHMLPAGMANYLLEIERLLADDGQVFMTFFLLNQRQKELVTQGQNAIDFKYGNGVCRMRDADLPESAVAYDEEYLLGLLYACGLAVRGPILYGTWCGFAEGLSFQDIIIATKRTIQRREHEPAAG
jgi:SAM-dependent methyltransferase